MGIDAIFFGAFVVNFVLCCDDKRADGNSLFFSANGDVSRLPSLLKFNRVFGVSLDVR